MKSSHKKVVEEALRLPVAARAALAGHLIESLEESLDEDAELAWEKEIARRIADLDKGNKDRSLVCGTAPNPRTISWPRQALSSIPML